MFWGCVMINLPCVKALYKYVTAQFILALINAAAISLVMNNK